MTFAPTLAFRLLHSFFPGSAPARPWGYKAPHAPQGTPPRLRRGKGPQRWGHNVKTGEPVVLRKIFNGHRP